MDEPSNFQRTLEVGVLVLFVMTVGTLAVLGIVSLFDGSWT